MYKLTDEQYRLAIQGLEVLQQHVTEQLIALKSLALSSEREPNAQLALPEPEPAKKRSQFSPAIRRQMSERVKALWNDPKYRNRVLATRRRNRRLKRQAKA